jgi:YbgC/YbaW family acyl-CoA thioester hydrolase
MDHYLQSFYTVRFSDCDPFRHLNNARYIDYFMNAREDHLKEHYNMDLNHFYQKGFGWVIMQHEIVYLRPANLNESVCIQSGLLSFNTDQIFLEMTMFDAHQRQLKALLHTRFVPVNLSTGKREPHSAEIMEFFSSKVAVSPGEQLALSQRVEYWQQLIKKNQTINQ